VYKTTGPSGGRQRQRADAGSRRLLQGGADSPQPVDATVYNGVALRQTCSLMLDTWYSLCWGTATFAMRAASPRVASTDTQTARARRSPVSACIENPYMHLVRSLRLACGRRADDRGARS